MANRKTNGLLTKSTPNLVSNPSYLIAFYERDNVDNLVKKMVDALPYLLKNSSNKCPRQKNSTQILK